MRYRELSPAPQLRHLVSCFWTLEREYGPAEAGETVWPDGKTELLFQYGDRYRLGGPDGDLLDRGALLGPLTRRLVLASAGRVRILGVRFHPWGLAGLLRVPVDELTDGAISTEALWGAHGRRLVERLSEADEGEGVRAVQAFLLGRARPASVDGGPIATLARAILDGPRVVPRACSRNRWRQVERRFKREIGLSPKRLAVIARFDAARRHLLAHPHDDLSDVACRFGYFDYSHLSKDFARFLGATPHAFRISVAARRAGDLGDVAFLHDPETTVPAV